MLLSRSGTNAPQHIGVLLMLYRLASNMFAHKGGAQAMMSSDLLSITTEVLSESILSTDEACRLVCAFASRKESLCAALVKVTN